ncbi:hypothetical protein G6F68_020500 [Rhizopus microsporus]|nr:hypothetical protein G6F68_020500 [Rhizopus microsporus]
MRLAVLVATVVDPAAPAAGAAAGDPDRLRRAGAGAARHPSAGGNAAPVRCARSPARNLARTLGAAQ